MALNGTALTSALSDGRVIGSYSTGESGPLILAMGGIHGNEGSGVLAIETVLQQLQEKRPPISGTFIGLLGNRPALARGTRCIDEDLNRCFRPERVTAPVPPHPSAEEGQLREITTIIDELAEHHDDICFIDCHTTSAMTVPYISVNEHPESLHLARHFPVSCVVGLEKSIPGCFGEYCNRLDYRGFTVEGGQHADVASIQHHEAMLWLLLVYSGAMRQEDLAQFSQHRDTLARHSTDGCRHFRLAAHYRISEGEQFVMRPGYVNFQRVSKGEVLAENLFGQIASPCDGRILLPLYQSQGDDGFFLLAEDD